MFKRLKQFFSRWFKRKPQITRQEVRDLVRVSVWQHSIKMEKESLFDKKTLWAAHSGLPESKYDKHIELRLDLIDGLTDKIIDLIKWPK